MLISQPYSKEEEKPAMAPIPQRRRIEVEDIANATIVTLSDKKVLEPDIIQIIGDQLFAVAEDDSRLQLVIDFSRVEYMTSGLTGKLITLSKRLQARKGKLILCNMISPVYEVFEITRLDKFFCIKKDADAALAAF